MTIGADFFKIIKDGCGEAFSDDLPVSPDLVFIDGQVKLMKADSVDVWSVFFSVQFYKTIEHCFATGARTVVLGFDDYQHVPASKAMTQAKRAKQRVDYAFAQSSSLPSAMPSDWGGAMANRTFKVRVICKILEVTRAWFQSKLEHDAAYRDRSLVLDYTGVPEVLQAALETPCSAAELLLRNGLLDFVRGHDWSVKPQTVGRGECDIKAYKWMAVSNCMCIVSTDGDYLPLSMLQMLQEEHRPADAGGGAPARCQVILYRMTTQTDTMRASKRKSLAADGVSMSSAAARRRTYEFVTVSTVSAWIRSVFPSKSQDPVRQFCAMVAVSGCDFARTLPRLGPRTLWKMRSRLQHVDLLQPAQALVGISMAYHDLFVMKNTLPVGVTNSVAKMQAVSDQHSLDVYNRVLARISADQRVSAKIREQLWPGASSSAHTRNMLWTVMYWTMLHDCPAPHSADFGYARDEKGRPKFAGT